MILRRSMGVDKPLVTLSVHEQHPVGCAWAQSENTRRTLSVMTISAFYLFESLYTILLSLSKGKGYMSLKYI